MARCRTLAVILPACVLALLFGTNAAGDELGMHGLGAHFGIAGVVSKIQSGIVFVKVPVGLRPRTISPNKADRVGLHEVKTGDEVVLWVDEGNVLVDVHKAGSSLAAHRIVVGNLDYTDTYWSEIKLSTPEGIERFDVDTLMGSKLSTYQEGARVMVELDEDNVAIDIHRVR
jgi:hypothetical protein